MDTWIMASNIASNVVVIALIVWMLKRSGTQEEKCSKHMITMARNLANRPEFGKMDEKIEKAIRDPEGKLTLLREEFRAHRKEILGHHHEGNEAKVVLGG